MSGSPIAGAAKRTLSALLKELPHNGVGALVSRDTWHPDSGKHWEIVSVRLKRQPAPGKKLQERKASDVTEDKSKKVQAKTAQDKKMQEVKAANEQKDETQFEAYGFLYFHGKRMHDDSKRVASVWKYGWYCKEGSVTAGEAARSQGPPSASWPPPGQPDTAGQREAAATSSASRHGQQVVGPPLRPGMPQGEGAICSGCRGVGHTSSSCPSRFSHTCHVCGAKGHFADDCSQRFKKWELWLGATQTGLGAGSASSVVQSSKG